MKKIITLSVFSLATLVVAAGSASAWWPWFPLCGCKKKWSKCCTTICLKQYNAFTPICTGSISCNGCCPQLPLNPCCGMAMCGPALFGYGAPSCDPCCGASCAPSSCCGCDSCALGQLPAPGSIQQPQENNSGDGDYKAPLPQPADGMETMNPYRYPAIQQQTYAPYPAANPYAQYPYGPFGYYGLQPTGYRGMQYPYGYPYGSPFGQ
ncbi:MAG: hypothetical protein KatS3mg105_1215 [Gemmatales bacterium]|nr:MAG: hypothetical protein KatS3mg105_1215 [Gemmatales bacterium]